MPVGRVFNAAQNQVLISPVSAYYEGKAKRASLKQAEADLELTQARTETLQASLEPDESEKTKLELEQLRLNVQKKRDELGDAEMKRRADAYGPIIEEATSMSEAGDLDGAIEFANKELRLAAEKLGPEVLAEFIEGLGEDRALDKEEIARIKYSISAYYEMAEAPLQQADYIDEAGIAQQGSFNPDTGQYEASGKSPIAPQAGQGDIRAGLGDKVSDRLTLEVIGGAENLISSINRIVEQVDKMPQSALGLPGSVASLIDNAVSAMSGFAEQLGGIAQVNGQEVDDSRLLDVQLYQEVFAGPAAQNAALQANSVGLAYALARSANPDGRISDADVRHQLGRVKLSGSSKTQIQAAISEVRREVLTNVANHLRVGGYTKVAKGKAAYDKYMKQLEKIQGPAIDDSGLQIGHIEDGYEYIGGDPGSASSWRKQ